MLRVHLRDYHRNIGSEAVSGVVGHYRYLMLCVFLFQRFYLVLFHINSAEDEIYLLSYLFDIL